MTCNKYIQDASINQSKDPVTEYPQLAIGMMEWTTSNDAERSELIFSRINMAQRAKRALVKIHCRNTHIVRRRALINNDIATWARYIRPSFRCSHGYSATWDQLPNGWKTKPTIKREARIGAAQEWEKLMKKFAREWKHHMVNQHKDEYGRVRMTLNTTAACTALP